MASCRTRSRRSPWSSTARTTTSASATSPSSPWEPSYRLVFENGKPILQSWGIVQNLSGEDWKDVQLSLVAGAPIAFVSTLATPVTPQRPVVTDSGELIAAVSAWENVLSAERSGGPAPASRAWSRGLEPAWPCRRPRPRVPRSRRRRRRGATGAPTRTRSRGTGVRHAEDESAGSSSPPSPTSAMLATAQVQGGSTRYDLPAPVSIPNDSATMVLVLSTPVPGESVFMFAPEGGVPDSLRHPFRGALHQLDAGTASSGGPSPSWSPASSSAQGVLEPLASGADATVPFALERAIALQSEQRWDQQSARSRRIEAGQLTIERDQVLRTTYKVQNGQAQSARVLVRHPRQSGMRLHAAPPGTQDRVAMGNALVPVEIAARSTAEGMVDERRAYSQHTDWMTEEANVAVKAYLDDSRADPKLAAALRSAWQLRESLRQTMEARQKLEGERAILSQATEEARENFNALKRNSGKGVDDSPVPARRTVDGARQAERGSEPARDRAGFEGQRAEDPLRGCSAGTCSFRRG